MASDNLKIDFFISDHENLRFEMVHHTHYSGPTGYSGRVNILDLLQRTYWQPQISQFVANFIKGCALCFRTKSPRLSPPGFHKPLKIPFRTLADISIDQIDDLPPCKHGGKIFHHILVIVDHLSKMRHFIPTTSLDTEELVECFIREVYRIHGAQDSIVSDRGSTFVSDFWGRLNTQLSVTLKHSSAFHLQTNGQTKK